ncbi:response regulator [Candidatus Woesearchaeota archaeon]|nr:response regulator [Candidatus Woesearchaeota archaeon]
MKNILILEDDKDTSNFYKLLLRHKNYNMQITETYEQAKKHFNEKINLTIIDLGIPGELSGLDFIKYIKTSPYNQTPIIMITANLYQKNTPNINADELLIKPIDNKTFIETIEKHIQREYQTH